MENNGDWEIFFTGKEVNELIDKKTDWSDIVEDHCDNNVQRMAIERDGVREKDLWEMNLTKSEVNKLKT